MKSENIGGGVTFLYPESKRDLRVLTNMITAGEADGGMDIQGFGKRPSLRETVLDIPGLLIETDGEDTWITKNGIHIMIGADGVITKGPAELVGKHISAIEHPKLKEVIDKLPNTIADPTKWSNSEFAAKLSDDPEIQKFVSGVKGFTDGKYDLLTNVTEAINKGDEVGAKKITADKTHDSYASQEDNERVAQKFFDQAKILNDAVKASDPKDVHIWRGLGVDRKLDDFEKLKPGDDLDIAGVKSFSWEKTVAADFAQRHGPIRYMLEVEGKAKGVSISALSEMTQEQEFMSQGKFSVTAVQQVSATTKVITMRQKAIF